MEAALTRITSHWAPLSRPDLRTESGSDDPFGNGSQRPRTREHKADSGLHGRRRLVCARCGHHITDEDARIRIGAQDEHVFVNPHGFVYRIVCFARAPGAREVGPAQTEFSWFPGYTWQVAACGRCDWHLGWWFRAGRNRFAGCISDRLRAIDSGDGDADQF